jgi:hypothetical protein
MLLTRCNGWCYIRATSERRVLYNQRRVRGDRRVNVWRFIAVTEHGRAAPAST